MVIDATMIHSEFFASKEEMNAYVASLLKDSGGTTVPWCRNDEDDASYDEYWTINFRPGLGVFLEQIATMAELHIYTAGSNKYAKDVARALEKQYDDIIWSREKNVHFHFDKEDKHYKFIDWLPLGRNDLGRVVIIDDNVNHQKLNPGNVDRIPAFESNSDDNELERSMEFLKNKLKDCDDVRPVLRERQKEADALSGSLRSVTTTASKSHQSKSAATLLRNALR